jgi:hypothetical protein
VDSFVGVLMAGLLVRTRPSGVLPPRAPVRGHPPGLCGPALTRSARATLRSVPRRSQARRALKLCRLSPPRKEARLVTTKHQPAAMPATWEAWRSANPPSWWLPVKQGSDRNAPIPADGGHLASSHKRTSADPVSAVAFLRAGGSAGGARALVGAVLNPDTRECGDPLFRPEAQGQRRAMRDPAVGLLHSNRGWPESFNGDPC